jgi:hypothetical protein
MYLYLRGFGREIYADVPRFEEIERRGAVQVLKWTGLIQISLPNKKKKNLKN